MPEKIKFKESQITKRSLARASSEAGDRRKQRPGERYRYGQREICPFSSFSSELLKLLPPDVRF